MSKVPLYYSNSLNFDLKGKKGFCTDRAKLKSLLPAIIVGFLLIVLGVYEWLNLLKSEEARHLFPVNEPISQPLLSAGFFDLCFVLVGLGVILGNIIRWLQYNKYWMDGDKVVIVHRRLTQKKKRISADLHDYVGVRFRVEFLQSGILTQNRYVVELYQKNADKIIPLYLSTSAKGVRSRWKEFAKKFKLPAIIFTDEGMKSVDVKDLNKSLATQYKQGLIADDYDDYDRMPSGISFVRKKDKKVIKIRKIVWDIYNMLAWVFVFIASVTMLASLYVVFTSCTTVALVVSAVCLVVIVVMVQVLFRKEKLVIKRHKIVNTHKYMLFSTKHNQIMKKDIEAVEITENPATGRCFVSIISDDNTITFGAKLKVKELRWLKRFLVHEIIK